MINIIKDKLGLDIKDKKTKSVYPIAIIEETFVMNGKQGETFFKVSFEVPVPAAKSADKEEIERLTQITDDTFRPIVVTLAHYLRGLSGEIENPERFLLGRTNLIEAIKQCSEVQLMAIRDAEKHR